VKASKQSIGRAVDQPNPQVRLFLFYGPDEAQSRALGQRLLGALAATKSIVAGGAVKNDPALLADEAGALSLFGGKRAIWVEPAGDEIGPAVEALFEAGSTENPVVAIGGALRKTSVLLKLAESSPLALAFAAYVPEGQDAQRMVTDVARSFGLKVSASLAARVADSCGNDQALVGQELQKFALYLDASPHQPKELTDEAVDAVGVGSADGEAARLADLALSGDVGQLAEQLARLPAGGADAIPVVRSLQRRILMLAPARARMERGENLDGVMTSLGKSLFWKDKAMVSRMLGQWDSDGLARVAERAGQVERSLIFTSAPDREALGEELIAIALQARRR
jgi:DNA polymerase-3 subunit delta